MAIKQRLETGELTQSCFDKDEYERMRCGWGNATVGNLTGYDCQICKNRGCLIEYRDGNRISVRCSCMDVRASIQRAAASGLQDLLRLYTMENYQTVEPNLRGTAQKRTRRPISHVA